MREDERCGRSKEVNRLELIGQRDASAASMQAPRIAPAVASSASSIFVFGGKHNGNALSSCELFDVQSGW